MTTKLRAIKVEFSINTKNGSARIRMSEDIKINKSYNSCSYAFDYEVGDILKQSTSILTDKGFNVVGHVENSKYYLIIVY